MNQQQAKKTIREVGYTSVFERNRESKATVVINVGGARSSKCLIRGTRVVMFSGELKNIEDIKPEDLVMGVDSKPRKVVEVHQGVGQLYTIHQSNGIDYTVNEYHLLTLKKGIAAQHPQGELTKKGTKRRPNGRYPSFNDPTTISVKEYLAKSQRWKRNFYGYRGKVEFPRREITIDPYFLGMWLGDGDSHRPAITNMDNEVVAYVYAYAAQLGLGIKVTNNRSKASNYFLTNGNCVGLGRHKNQLVTLLKFYKLLKDKHIPDDYLYNDRGTRLQLLAGILDTDGSLHSNGFNITQKSEKLARQIYYLSCSLGFKTFIAKRTNTIKSIGFSGEYWDVAVYGDTYLIPTRVERKKATKSGRTDSAISSLVVTDAGWGEYFGFSLDGDGLFFVDDFTVVHNSYSIAQLLIEKLLTEDHKLIGICRKTFPSLRMTAMKQIFDLLKDYGVYREAKHNKSFNTYEYGTNLIQFFGLDETEKIKSAEFNYLWMEEGNEFTYEDYIALKLRLSGKTKEGEQNHAYLSLNPVDSHNWIAMRAAKETDVELVKSTYQDNPYLSQEYIRFLTDLINQDENSYRVYVLGEWGLLEGKIYTNYKVIPELPEMPKTAKWCYGLDFGLVNPTAVVKVYLLGDKFYLEERFYETGKTNADIIEFFSHEAKGDIYADPTEKMMTAEIQRAGYSAFEGHKGVKDGIDLCQRQTLFIPQSSTHLIKEIQNYHWRKDKNATGEEAFLPEPVKFNDHLMDAMRYAIFGITSRYGFATQRPRSLSPIRTLHFGRRNRV